QREVGLVDGQLGHALAPPTCQVRHEDLLAQMKLGLEQDDPATGPAASPMKWRPKLASKNRGGQCVLGRRTRKRVQHTKQDLPGDVRWQRQDVLVGRWFSRCFHHTKRSMS